MCAKKKASANKMWKLAGEPIYSISLTLAEREEIEKEFFVYKRLRGHGSRGIPDVIPAEARIHESAVQAVAGTLCQHYAGRFQRSTVIKVIAATAAVPANLPKHTSNGLGFLVGAALWLLNYLEDACDDPDEYLDLLPKEAAGELEYYMPCAEDLIHDQDTILRMVTVLEGREKTYRKAFRSLLDLIDPDTAAKLLKMLKANHAAMQYEMQDKALKYYPQQMAETKLFIEALGKDLPIVQAHPVKDDAFTMTVMGQVFTERKAAGEAIIKACMLMSDPEKVVDLGEYRGFPMQLHCNGFKFKVTMKQHLTYTAELSDDPVGNVTRINNALEGMAENLKRNETRLARLESELKNAQEEAERPFPKEEELRQKSARLTQLNRELEKPSNKGANQHQNSDGRPNLEDGGAPVREQSGLSVVDGGKPSIRQAIRDFNPPAPVSSGMEKGQRREAAL